MRTIVVSSLFALGLALAACKEPDPNKFETHIEALKDPGKRQAGFTGLERLTMTVVTARDNKDLIQEFVDKVVPTFVEIWDEAPEQQKKMLELLRDVGNPAGAPLWNKALALDGSGEAREKAILALDGIRKAKATDSVDAIVGELDKLIKDPKNDKGEKEEGRVRLLMAETLGALKDKKAVPVLIKAMEQTQENQPVSVHRAAAKALGDIGDPSAVDALLTVTFRVPDVPTTTSIGERSKLALVAIGEPAIPAVVQMLRFEHEEVKKLAAEHGLDTFVVQQTAASILGAMGSPAAVDELLKFMPMEDCKPPAEGKKKDEETEPDPAFATLRGVIANALGFIGDPKAAEQLCTCATSSKNPGDMFPILEALGRMGGPKAVDCLVGAIKTAEYNTEFVEKDFKYEPRWESGRFVILVATPEDVPKIKEAFAAQTDPKVKEKLAGWQPGIDVLEKCKTDKGCYLGVLQDSQADWIAREKAAFEVARTSDGDLKMAEEIAKAFKVRDPSARVSMAWLPAKMLHGKKCPECVTALQAVLEAEKLSMDKLYQASVITARGTIMKLGGDEDATSGAAKGAPAGDEKKGG